MSPDTKGPEMDRDEMIDANSAEWRSLMERVEFGEITLSEADALMTEWESNNV